LEFPKGDPREPMTEEDLDNKFEGLSHNLMDDNKRKEIKEVIFDCDNYSAKDFMEKLKLS
jgi:2-methylcitrate dehydratase